MSKSELLKKYQQQRQPVQCWTRVMGYLRNVESFNIGKKGEFSERKWFTECKAKTH